VKWINANGALTSDDYLENAAVECTEKMHSNLKTPALRDYLPALRDYLLARAENMIDRRVAGKVEDEPRELGLVRPSACSIHRLPARTAGPKDAIACMLKPDQRGKV
jgi:hypothetical protein